MKTDVFYTGGGIWLSEGILDNGTCAIVSSEFPEFLSVYNINEEEPYLSEDMIFSKHVNELDEHYKEIYNNLLIELNKRSSK